MTKFRYIVKSFVYHLKANLLVALGVAVSTMVLTGSLIIGDSVRYSLEQTAFYRLGEMTHLAAVTERYFRSEMAEDVEKASHEIKASPALLLEGIAVAGGGKYRVNRIQVVGIDNRFENISGTVIFSGLKGNEVIISKNLAEKLKAAEGDQILVRVKKASLIPLNAPFVSAEETSVSMLSVIKKIVDKEEMGRFSLKTSQTAPYNLFVSLDQLNALMEFKNKANHLLIHSHLTSGEIQDVISRCLIPADAGLKLKYIDATAEMEISTERVFMEPGVAQILEQMAGASPLITYFVNGIMIQETNTGREGNKGEEVREVPYSFVSTLADGQLSDNEIILTEWAADDLGARPGDPIRLKYLEVGPLRQLIDRESDFILKEIVPMTRNWADSTRMPWLPGLSDAGHCREWEAGVPINLDAIRDKDEEYWNKWRGAPKAYISLNKARQIWENRFGAYTAIRFPAGAFNEQKYLEVFSQNIHASALGMAVEPIREQSIVAARNGTDFSGLFLGLSFFILVASIILTALLFRLNLETRSAEAGTLSALGFKESQVRSFFLWEGLVIALAGGLAGLALSILYTAGVFEILNTLWFEIVRTNVLLISINPLTLLAGLAISIAVSLGAIFLSVLRYRKQKTVELQRHSWPDRKNSRQMLTDVLMWVFLSAAVLLTSLQLLNNAALNPMIFFLSGGLLLSSFLLAARKMLTIMNRPAGGKIRLDKLSVLNLARNPNRSLTVVVLFALGTFIVISTGSYRLDLLAGSQKKTSGTGGFLFFAETTMPVLFDLNDPVRRSEEGIYEDFKAVQFSKVEGDDASCLNLNRISQPAVLGVNPEALSGRFAFAATFGEGDQQDQWLMLNKTFPDGSVPAIADQTVIQWGLGKKVGDELLYLNEKGDTLRLKLIAGTIPSVFQGYVIISDRHFLRNYPSASGSSVFLIEGKPENRDRIGEELSSVFRDSGWEMQQTAERLVEFYSVTNTYLSIFMALGALGLILGTIGLAIILARTVLERRQEIALMQAIGFSKKFLFRLISAEYLMLLFAGVFIGLTAALVATLPSFISAAAGASPGTTGIIVLLISVNGILWIGGLSRISLRQQKLITGLRVD